MVSLSLPTSASSPRAAPTWIPMFSEAGTSDPHRSAAFLAATPRATRSAPMTAAGTNPNSVKAE